MKYIYPREIKTHIYKKNIHKYLAALLMNAEKWEHPIFFQLING